MKIYLVGGAVRDELLGLPVNERDWVVVGTTQTAMLAAGYQRVGKDFPVFLHPITKEEYALARKEKKIAKGYHGFSFDADAAVTLEEDLMRRDLTINAIAKDETGKLIDPYHGIADLHAKKLRHISPAFTEDPVRILRVARFAARFINFCVSDTTNRLMTEMVQAGEVDALVAERVYKEFEKAMSESAPWRFIEVLHYCQALPILFPVFAMKKNEIILCLKNIATLTSDPLERIVLMIYATQSVVTVEYLCQRYRIPKSLVDMAQLLLRYQSGYQAAMQMSAQEILDLLMVLDAFRREARFKQWLRLCEINTACATPAAYLVQAFTHIHKVELSQDFLKKNKGKNVAQYIYQRRLESLVRERK